MRRSWRRWGSWPAALTQQLLAFSRRQVLRPQILSPNRVVRELEGMLGRLIGEHIRVETRLEESDVPVRVDRGQLEQVLVNLVVNARDAMPGGGTVRIETDVVGVGARDARVRAWQIEPGHYVRIRVRDTGPGMDEETLARAFEPFFTTKAQGEGTGLGLSTVFGILKQSGGHVALTSSPGEGTVCDVFVPAAEAVDAAAPEETGTPAGSRAAPPGERGTVLVVEDEGAVRRLAVRILKRRGYRVLSAENGLGALDTVARHPGGIDLVLTDMIMPDMGGRELLAAIRKRGDRIPIILMSGYDEDMVAEVGERTDFLAKPFTPSALAERVARNLDPGGTPLEAAAG